MVPKDFNDYFSMIYGDRWPQLLSVLSVGREVQIARWNRFLGELPSGQGAVGLLQEKPLLPDCYEFVKSSEVPRSESGLLGYYVMDPASVVAARALGVQAGDRVLDLCAAPGGKSLILAEAIAEKGELIANEPSVPRKERLKKVIQQYVPRDIRDRIWVTGYDGARWASQQTASFDKILVDAPCSGERYLLENPKELKEWSISRSKQLAHRQYALVAGAILALKSGGRLIYSTCSISPLENDGVIEKVLKKKGDLVRLVAAANFETSALGSIEASKFGSAIFPDRNGWGPIYFSVLEKI